MSDIEKIEGDKLVNLFECLKNEKTGLSLRLACSDAEMSTQIIDIKKKRKSAYLRLIAPQDLNKAILKASRWEINFEFKGPDGLDHYFKTIGGKFHKEEILLPFPSSVERLQQRQNFRVAVPKGIKFKFMLNKHQEEIDLINISLSGAYGVLLTSKSGRINEQLLNVGDLLNQIRIFFPEMCSEKISVNEATVRRVEHDSERERYGYAFEFTDLEKNEKNNLQEVIYYLQREFIRKNRLATCQDVTVE